MEKRLWHRVLSGALALAMMLNIFATLEFPALDAYAEEPATNALTGAQRPTEEDMKTWVEVTETSYSDIPGTEVISAENGGVEVTDGLGKYWAKTKRYTITLTDVGIEALEKLFREDDLTDLKSLNVRAYWDENGDGNRNLPEEQIITDTIDADKSSCQTDLITLGDRKLEVWIEWIENDKGNFGTPHSALVYEGTVDGIDNSAPVQTEPTYTFEDGTAYESGTWTDKPVTLHWNVTEDDTVSQSPLSYTFDGGANWQETPTKVFNGSIEIPQHQIYVRDAAGNYSETKYPEDENNPIQILVDTMAPSIQFNDIDMDTISKDGVEISGKATDGGSGIEKNADGKAFITVTLLDNETTEEILLEDDGSFTYMASENGSYKFSAKDMLGNKIESSTQTIGTIDKEAPLASVTPTTKSGDNYTAGTWVNEDVILTVSNSNTENKGTTSYYYTTDEETSKTAVTEKGWTIIKRNSETTFGFTVSAAENTTTANTYYIKAVSESGVESAAIDFAVNITTVKPTLSPVDGNFSADRWTNERISLRITKGVSIAPVDHVEVAFGSNKEDRYTQLPADAYDEEAAQYTYSASENGIYYFRAVDEAGNVGEAVSVAVTQIDKTKPTVSITFDKEDNADNVHGDTRTATITVTDSSAINPNVNAVAVAVATTLTGKENTTTQTLAQYFDAYNTANNTEFKVEWTKENNEAGETGETYTIEVPFKGDAQYSLSVTECKDTAGNTADVGTATATFTMDNTAPAATVKAGTWTDKFEDFLHDISFGLYSKDPVDVTVNPSDANGIASISYITSETALTEAVVTGKELVDNQELVWKTVGSFTADTDNTVYTINTNERVIVYVRVVDKAGNETYRSTNGMVFDNLLDDGATIAFAIGETTLDAEETDKTTTIASGYYIDDVPVTITITDPTPEDGDKYVGSWLKTASYQIVDTTKGDASAWTELYTEADNTADDDKKEKYEKEVTINANDYNSNGVQLVVKVEDNAGNKYTETLQLQIDTTRPTVAIDGVSENTYYKENTTATVTVTERNFDAENTIIIITREDDEGAKTAAQYTIVDGTATATALDDDTAQLDASAVTLPTAWTETVGTGNGDDTTNTATVTFVADGDYTIEVFSQDLPKNSTAKESIEPAFTIDKTLPTIELSYDTDVWTDENQGYFQSRTATITVTEHNFDEDRFVARLACEYYESPEDSGDLQITKTNYPWTSDGNTHTITIPVTEDGVYDLEIISYTDLAQNKETNVLYDDAETNLDKTNHFTIDNTPAKIKVVFEKNDAQNDNYFKADRTATFYVTEKNFEAGTFTATITATDKDGNGIAEACKNIDKDDFSNVLSDGATPAPTNVWSYTHTFNADAHYVISDIKFTDRAGLETTVDADGCTQLDETIPAVAPLDFYVDKTAPTGEVSVKGFTGITADESKFTTVWKALLDKITFGLFSNSAITVTVTSDDNLDAVHEVRYFKHTANDETGYYTSATALADLDEDKWTDKYETPFELKDNQRVVVYVRIVDKAGNATYLSSDGMVYDNLLHDKTTIAFATPHSKDNSPEWTENLKLTDANGTTNYSNNDGAFYKQSDTDTTVPVEVTITDPSVKLDGETATYVGAGLRKISYEIYAEDTGARETVELDPADFSGFSITDPTIEALNDAKTHDFTINVDKAKFNSNQVVVTVNVEDNAGNTYSETLQLKIDITAPTAEITGVSPETYYNADTTATITVTERNFNEENTFLRIFRTDDNGVQTAAEYQIINGKVTATKFEQLEQLDENAVKVTGWTQTDGKASGNGDDTTNTATVTFVADGDYTIGVWSQDLAENPTAMAMILSAFTIDQTLPTIVVSFDNNDVRNDSYFAATRTATITVTEHNFDAAQASATITKCLNDGSTTPIVWEDASWVTAGNVHTMTVAFDEDADYTFGGLTVTDKATNVAPVETYADGSKAVSAFTVDLTTPTMTVAFNENDVMHGAYFKAPRTATVTINEHNFMNDAYAHGIDVTVTATDKNGTDIAHDATQSVEAYLEALLENASAWTKSGDTYTAEIPFAKDANYTFDIQYTDLAQRSTPAKGTADYNAQFGASKAPNKFTIDTLVPTVEISVKSNEAYELVNGVLVSLKEKVWAYDTESVASVVDGIADAVLNVFTFGWWSSAALEVNIQADDTLSGVQQLSYFHAATAIADFMTCGYWNGLPEYQTQTTYMVSDDEQLIIYTSVEDRAGNKTYLSSDGMIVDMTNPTLDTINPEIEIKQVNELYNTDFNIEVVVTDPSILVQTDDGKETEVYSGLSELTYTLTNKDTGKVTQEGTLAGFVRVDAQADPTKAVQTYSNAAAIRVLANEANNSNNLELVVTAVDHANNRTVSEPMPLAVDITNPTIAVSYDNNKENPNEAGYFNDDRTATIVVTERNFDPENTIVTIENTDGSAVPSIGEWVKKEAGENGDATTHTTTVTYSADGKYEFDITTTDLVGNKMEAEVDYGSSVAPQKFCLDKTIPEITVTYDNNAAQNGNYYKEARTATVTVTEHNFDSKLVEITMTAVDDGAEIALPTVSSWSRNGDDNSATIAYSADALYTFDISFVDMAANEAVDFEEETFYVDTTVPTLEITGVEDKTANSGVVMPVVTYADTNLDAESVSITLLGVNRGDVALKGKSVGIHNGKEFTFDDFAQEKDIDDVYTLSAMLTDMAGNTSEAQILFSVNRFGSTYWLGEETADINGSYIQKPIDVEIHEINPNALSNIKLTLFKDGAPTVLKQGEEYRVDKTGNEGTWYEYTYTIFAKQFAADGIYSVTIESDDAAGNHAKNDIDTKNTPLQFGVDTTLPIINVENLDSKTTYSVDVLTVRMSVKDNLKLAEVYVVLNGNEIAGWRAEELEALVKNGGNFTFDIPGDSTDAHDLVIYAVDLAGNGQALAQGSAPENAVQISDFYVTTNVWVRYYTNKPLFYGSIAGAIAAAGSSVAFVGYRRKKKVTETV